MAQTTITEEEKNGMDIFDILGPVMVGPSSSHTAGAARIGAMARTLLGEEVADAKLHLYGSFAETGKGHGTDRALVAGLLGMKPDDLRIPNAFEEAKKAGLRYTIDEIDLREAEIEGHCQPCGFTGPAGSGEIAAWFIWIVESLDGNSRSSEARERSIVRSLSAPRGTPRGSGGPRPSSRPPSSRGARRRGRRRASPPR